MSNDGSRFAALPEPSALRTLLKGEDPFVVAESIIDRSLLSDGRFEAQHFGRNAHSTASAGALLHGMARAAEVPDRLFDQVLSLAADLVTHDGSVRGHDTDTLVGSTSWSASQLLLGLVSRPHLAKRHERKIFALTAYLLTFQDADDGGWPFRFSEQSSSVFAFYPSLALAKVRTLGLGPTEQVETAIAELVRYHRGCLDAIRDPEASDLCTEELVLSLVAIEVLLISSRRQVPMGFLARFRSHVLERATSGDGSHLALANRAVTSVEQPMWHATLWYPLLYLAYRRWASPNHPAAAHLAWRLIEAFDPEHRSWHGPIPARQHGTGLSWSSSIAFGATSILARDLSRADMTLDDLEERVKGLAEPYQFDVVISFGGPDRATAERIAARLKGAGLRVFYDFDFQHELLGEDLAVALHEIYFKRSRYAVAVLSQAFVDSEWAGNWEWRAVLARMQQERSGYLLPYYVEDVSVPGLNATIGYVRNSQFSPEEFADLVVRKLGAPNAR